MSTRDVGGSRRGRAARARRDVESEEEMFGITSQLDANLGIASSNAAMAACILGRPELVTLGEIIDAALASLRRGDPRRSEVFVEALSVLRKTNRRKRKRGTDGAAKRRFRKRSSIPKTGAMNPRESTLAIKRGDLRETMNASIPKRYVVVFEPDEGGWHTYIPEVQGCRTWGPSLEESRVRIREALSLFDDDANEAEFVEDVRTAAAEET